MDAEETKKSFRTNLKTSNCLAFLGKRILLFYFDKPTGSQLTAKTEQHKLFTTQLRLNKRTIK
jgi:hypothetical protein